MKRSFSFKAVIRGARSVEISASILRFCSSSRVTFRYVTEINRELEVIQSEERGFNSELFEKENEEEPAEVKHDINQFFDFETIQAFQDKLIEILQACHYQGAGSARLNMETFDLEVGVRAKAILNGGGYRGFLNTVVALALIEFWKNKVRIRRGCSLSTPR